MTLRGFAEPAAVYVASLLLIAAAVWAYIGLTHQRDACMQRHCAAGYPDMLNGHCICVVEPAP